MGKPKKYICDGCSGEYTGEPVDVAKEGWCQHEYTKGKKLCYFLLCDDCEAKYEKVWQTSKPA